MMNDGKENIIAQKSYASGSEFDKLYNPCNEIIRILNSIILTTKRKYLLKS